MPKNPERETTWNKNKVLILRVGSKDQQDMFRYVPGRMPKLLRKAQADYAAEFKEALRVFLVTNPSPKEIQLFLPKTDRVEQYLILKVLIL